MACIPRELGHPDMSTSGDPPTGLPCVEACDQFGEPMKQTDRLRFDRLQLLWNLVGYPGDGRLAPLSIARRFFRSSLLIHSGKAQRLRVRNLSHHRVDQVHSSRQEFSMGEIIIQRPSREAQTLVEINHWIVSS